MCPLQKKSRASRKICFEQKGLEPDVKQVNHWIEDSISTYFGIALDEFVEIEETAGHFVHQFYSQQQNALAKLVFSEPACDDHSSALNWLRTSHFSEGRGGHKSRS